MDLIGTARQVGGSVLQWLGRKTMEVGKAMNDDGKICWPPEAHQPRLRRYERNRKLYKGEHEGVFVGGYKAEGETFKYSYDDTVQYIAVNFLGRITKLLSSRLFGEEMTLTTPEGTEDTQAWLKSVWDENHMDTRCMQVARGASYRGDALFKIRYDADARQIRIGTINPGIWYPVTAPLDRTQLIGHVVGQVLKGANGDPEDAHLWIERHEMRDQTSWIVNELYRVEEDGGTWRYDPVKDLVSPDRWRQWDVFAALEPEVDTGVDDFLLVHVPNLLADDESVWGTSDYEGLVDLQGEYNNRMTQREDILDKHTDPTFIGPKDALVIDPDNPTDSPSVDMRRLKYIGMREDGRLPAGYVTWDGSLEHVENELKEMRDDVATVSGIDVSAFRPVEGGPASGRAIKLGQMNTQSTVKEKHGTFGPGLKRVGSVCTKLANSRNVRLSWEGAIDALEPTDLGVVFADGLPSDEIEDAQYQGDRIASGTQHPVDAIMRLDGLSRDAAEDKYARILASQANAVAPNSVPPVGLQFDG